MVSHESLAGFIESVIQLPIVAKIHRGLMYAPFNSPDNTNKLQDKWRDTLNYAFNTDTLIGYGGSDHSLMAFVEDEKTMMRHGMFWWIPDKASASATVLLQSNMIALRSSWQHVMKS